MRSFLALLAVALCAVVLGQGRAADDDKDFVDVFNGKDFKGLKFEIGKSDPEKTWSVKDGVIICTGKPNGYFYTDKSYKNFVMRYDWRYKRPDNLKEDKDFGGNSGALMHIQEPHKVWPKCVEVQGENRTHGSFIFISCKGTGKYDKAAKDKAVKPVGEWNTTEITCLPDGAMTVKINGADVNAGMSELTEGPFGFQSEGAEIHFKNIKVKQLK
ncbi:MAG TPA: DUF1080 domain-containing protein [Gemmataceae bacterium]|nr:DUF1080 domain-containing protein [Gemmataceae bacterium]